MTCITVDDEPIALEILADYLAKLEFIQHQASFRNPLKALTYLAAHPIDLLFLDINMPDLSGLQLLRSNSLLQPMVIFVTAYPDYALEGYEFRTIDYLLKPISLERFLRAVNKAHRTWQQTRPRHHLPNTREENSIQLKSGGTMHLVLEGDVLYVEGAGNYLTFVTVKKKILVRMNMQEALELLPKEGFVQIHKSYIISLRHIKQFNRYGIWIADQQIPIGPTFKAYFFKTLHKKSGL